MDRRLVGATLLLLALLGLHVYSLYAVEQLRSTASYAEEAVEDLEVRVEELRGELETLRAAVVASKASDAVDSVIADHDLVRLRLSVEQASMEAQAAEQRAEEVADALCRATRYSECP